MQHFMWGGKLEAQSSQQLERLLKSSHFGVLTLDSSKDSKKIKEVKAQI